MCSSNKLVAFNSLSGYICLSSLLSKKVHCYHKLIKARRLNAVAIITQKTMCLHLRELKSYFPFWLQPIGNMKSVTWDILFQIVFWGIYVYINIQKYTFVGHSFSDSVPGHICVYKYIPHSKVTHCAPQQGLR